MALPHAEEHSSDDDFFFGPLTLKEVKKHILGNKTRRIIPCSFKTSDQEKSFKLIESHSEPNLLHARTTPGSSSSKSSNGDIRTSDDTFIQSEHLVAGCSDSHDQGECKLELNNTLEVIDYILKHGPPKDIVKNKGLKIEDDPSQTNEVLIKVEDTPATSINSMPPTNVEHVENFLSPAKTDQQKQIKVEDTPPTSINCMPLLNVEQVDNFLTPAKPDRQKQIKVEDTPTTSINCMPLLKVEHDENFLTPAKTDQQNNVFVTPSSEIRPKSKINLFKTPVSTPSSTTHLKGTYSKSKAYDHICSPVAAYINKTPQFPIMRDARPKKPLTSCIPKYVYNSTQKKTFSTPNINLPSIAYRSAKKTQVVDIPDQERLPNCEWAKKITSTIPKPMVMKHMHREVDFTRKPLSPKQEDSFAGLPYHQADISVCTLKSAMNLKKH